MNYAYLRVSSLSQVYGRQRQEFRDRNIHIDVVYKEKRSGKNAKDRPELQKMLAAVQDGDQIYITELSRLGRSVADLADIVDKLREKNVGLHSLKEGFEVNTPAGKLMYVMLSGFAEFERDIIRERQASGIAAAKESGKTWGAKKQYFSDEAEEDAFFMNYYNGEMEPMEAIAKFGGSKGNFYKRYRAWRNKPDVKLPPNNRKPGNKPGSSMYRGYSNPYNFETKSPVKKMEQTKKVVKKPRKMNTKPAKLYDSEPKMDKRRFKLDPEAEMQRYSENMFLYEEENQ